MPDATQISPELAVAAVLTGCFFVFFGYLIFRATIVLYLAVVGAVIAGVIGQSVAGTAHPVLWTAAGAMIGALLGIPAEAFARMFIGVVSGGMLGLAIGVFADGALYGMVGLAVGALFGAILWAWVGEIFLMGAFALIGSMDVLAGVHGLSAHYGRPFEIGPLSIGGVFVSTLLGTAFQYILLRPPRGPVPEREGEHFDENSPGRMS